MVAITFRTTGAWGVGAGSNLTPAQVDTNFYNLKAAVEYIEANPPEAVSVESISQAGNQITFNMTDATTQGPFTLPAAEIVFRGDWVALTAYAVGDIVAVNSALYIVLTAHTSEASFDPGANNGSGADYYDQILGSVLPVGGTTGQVLTKLSNTDYDVGWVDVPGDGSGGAASTFFDGAILFTATATTGIGATATSVIFDDDYYPDYSWVNNVASPIRLKMRESCLVEVGFQLSLVNCDAGATYHAYVNPDVGAALGGMFPSVTAYNHDQTYVELCGSTTIYGGATLEMSLKVKGSSGSFDTYAAGCSFWVRKIGDLPV